MPETDVVEKDNEVKDEVVEEAVEEKSVWSMTDEELSATERGEDISEESDDDEKDNEDSDDNKDEESESDNEEDSDKDSGDESKNDDSDEKVTITKSELDKLKKRVDDKDEHIKKIESDNFTLREKKREQVKVLEEKQALLDEALGDRLQEGGVDAAAALKESNDNQVALESARVQEQTAINKSIVNQFAPDFGELTTDIVEILKSDNAPEDAILKFQQEPLSFPAGELINLSKRVHASRGLIAKDKEIESLKSKIETLKKKPDKLLDKIEKNLKGGKKMTADSGGTGTGKDKEVKSVYSMTTEELKLAEQGKLK